MPIEVLDNAGRFNEFFEVSAHTVSVAFDDGFSIEGLDDEALPIVAQRVRSAGAAQGVQIRVGGETWRVDLTVDEAGVLATFPDGSTSHIGPPALDDGPALLAPVTQLEHAAIEKLLGLLVVAAAKDELTEPQQKLILTIADLIREEQRESTPEKTARGGLVAVVRRGFKFFMSGDDVVKNALAWSQVIEILYEIGWRVTAKQLGG